MIFPSLRARLSLLERRHLLWALVFLGSCLRLSLPFYSNPLDHLFSDPLRHFNSAQRPLWFDVLNLQDQIGYQIWLSAVLRFTGKNHGAVALYAGLLGVVTPWVWYGWMRECIPSCALQGYAILTWVPSWIKTECYFLQETLLLLLLGLALWVSWRAARQLDWRTSTTVGVLWGATVATKASALPMFVIVWLWLTRRSYRRERFGGLALSALILGLTIAGYSLSIFKMYCATGLIVSYGNRYNQAYYESGKKDCLVTTYLPDGIRENPEWAEFDMEFGSPSLGKPQFTPFSQWTTQRRGLVHIIIDYRKPYPMQVTLTALERAWMTLENILFFLFGETWPGDGGVSDVGNNVRFLWAPMALAVALCALLHPRCRSDILTWLCLGSLLVFLLQQGIVSEGRYRLPWEGIVVAAYLALFVDRTRLQQGGHRQSFPGEPRATAAEGALLECPNEQPAQA